MAKAMLKTGTRRAVDEASILDQHFSETPNDCSPHDNLHEIKQMRVPDEEFRLAVEKMLEGIVTLPKHWNSLKVREQRDWVYEQMRISWPDVPDSLIFLCVGTTINGDCDHGTAVPEWLDLEKFKRGQRFAMNNFAGTAMAEVLSLYVLFSFEYGLKPLIVTGKSSEPFTSFKRYLSTTIRVKNWYSSDVWTPGTEGYNDMQTVRKMHANIRKRLSDWSHLDIDEAAKMEATWSPCREKIRNDFRGSCQAPTASQCPYMFSEEDRSKRPKCLNQCEMAATQFGFMGLIILYPNSFGIHRASDEDLDDYCHLWRGLGYLLGIEDEFNFCRGTLEEIKQRSRDFLEYWVKPNFREITPEWEHMMRCVMEGITYYFPAVTYEHCLLYLADTLDVQMPRLRASLSYTTWMRFNFMKVTFRWTSKFPGIPEIMNRRLMSRIDRALRYTDEELAVLRLRSKSTLSKGIFETNEVNRDLSTAAPTVWQKAPLIVFLSTLFLLNLPIIVKDYAKKLLRVDTTTPLQS